MILLLHIICMILLLVMYINLNFHFKMTVVFTTCSCIAMASLLFTLWNLQHIKRKTRESSQAVMMFEAQQIRRDADDNLHAEIWSPPEQFFCVTGSVDGMLSWKVMKERNLSHSQTVK